MSLRCSILGHSYGETEIEREREEQGSEVVVTVREFEECERCGDRKVVTENKEVTTLESPASDLDSAADDAAADDATTGDSTTEGGATVDAGTGATADAGVDANAGGSAGTGATGVPDEGVPASGDDAEILDDSTDAESSGQSSAGESSASGQSSESGARGQSGGSDATGQSAGASGTDRSGTTSGDASSGSESGDAGDATATATDSADDAEESRAADDAEESRAADDDDGVILDDDGGDATDDRTPREWPDADTTHPAETDESGSGDWPDVGREDEGFDAEPGDGESADVEFDGMAATESSPDVADDETEEVEFVNADGDTLEADDGGGSDEELSSGISAGAEAPTLSGPADDPDVDAEFVCPECDYRASVSGSSLRAGDICPECSRGYLAQE